MAEDNNKILVEIVLDDGSIQKGFAKFKAAGSDTAKGINKDFEKIGEGLEGSALSKVKSFLSGISVQAAATGAALAGLGFIIKEAFDLTLQGESIKLVNKQFDILATQSIGASQELKKALVDAAGGFVDTEEVLKATNKALVDFQGNASDLPRLFELARKSSKVTGNDIVQTFEDINRAIASQNLRVLRQSGIFLDATKVQKDYADSINKSVKELSEQDKRQSITNALLKVGDNNLKDISLTTENATTSFKKLKVELKELGDAIALASAKTFGGVFSRLSKDAAGAVENITLGIVSTFGTGAEKTAAQVRSLEKELARLNVTASNQQSVLDVRLLEETQKRIASVTAELQKFRDIQSAAADDARKASRSDGSAVPSNVQAAITAADELAKARVLADQKATAEIAANRKRLPWLELLY